MTDRPLYPMILTDNTTGYLDLIEDNDYLINSNALGLIKQVQKNIQAYDKNGILWKVDKANSNYRINSLTRFLAYTVYNPKIKVIITWAKVGHYDLEDLKRCVNRQVDRDDDILTQFENGEIIKGKIENCESFDDIIKALNKYIFNVN
jgi:hypothetical protein